MQQLYKNRKIVRIDQFADQEISVHVGHQKGYQDGEEEGDEEGMGLAQRQRACDALLCAFRPLSTIPTITTTINVPTTQPPVGSAEFTAGLGDALMSMDIKHQVCRLCLAAFLHN